VRTNIEWLGGVVATLGIVACSDDGQAQNGSMADDGIASLDTAGSEDGIGDLDGGGPKLDLPGGADGMDGGDEAGDQGCQKVDFLFVVDSSPSMEDEQDNLLVSFPGFISAIEDTLMVDDFHVMVIDASQTPGGGCDGTLGAGRTSNANGQDCGLVGGQRYATEEQPDLVDAFTCMASRGAEGDPNEQTMNSLLASIGPLNGAGECNEGFLRDDAVLVVTIITDEEDSPGDAGQGADGACHPADDDPNSNGDPGAWRQAIVSAKHDDEQAMVVLALTGDCDAGGDCEGILIDQFNPGAPITGAEPAPRVREFATSFGYGSVGPICADDFAPFFADAVSVIESACNDFEPPG
jgi:hypothetical protein